MQEQNIPELILPVVFLIQEAIFTIPYSTMIEDLNTIIKLSMQHMHTITIIIVLSDIQDLLT